MTWKWMVEVVVYKTIPIGCKKAQIIENNIMFGNFSWLSFFILRDRCKCSFAKMLRLRQQGENCPDYSQPAGMGYGTLIIRITILEFGIMRHINNSNNNNKVSSRSLSSFEVWIFQRYYQTFNSKHPISDLRQCCCGSAIFQHKFFA